MLPDNSEGPLSGPIDVSAGTTVLEPVPDDNTIEGGEQDQSSVPRVDPRQLPRDAPIPQADRIQWEYRCKICQLAVSHPSLYEKIHTLIIKDGRSYNSTINEMNAYFTQHRLRISCLNMMNMMAHFKKHVGVETQVQLTIAKQNAAAIVPQAAQSSLQNVQAMADVAVGDDVDDFNNLNELRVHATNILRRLEAQLDVIDPSTKQMRLDKFALNSYVKLISEVRACITDLNKMRQSERLLNTVVQSLLERLTFAIIPQLLEEYKVVMEELRAADVPPDVVQRCDLRLRVKTAEIIATTARAAVMEVSRQFGIH